MNPKYNEDVYGWAIHTAQLLRINKMDEVDFDNIIEEIESLGRSEKGQLINRLSLILSHLLKWQYQPARKTRSWDLTIKENRRRFKNILKDNPSLKSKLDEILDDAYYYAKLEAGKETSIDEGTFPEVCPYSFEEITNDEFYPQSK